MFLIFFIRLIIIKSNWLIISKYIYRSMKRTAEFLLAMSNRVNDQLHLLHEGLISNYEFVGNFIVKYSETSSCVVNNYFSSKNQKNRATWKQLNKYLLLVKLRFSKLPVYSYLYIKKTYKRTKVFLNFLIGSVRIKRKIMWLFWSRRNVPSVFVLSRLYCIWKWSELQLVFYQKIKFLHYATPMKQLFEISLENYRPLLHLVLITGDR